MGVWFSKLTNPDGDIQGNPDINTGSISDGDAEGNETGADHD